MTPRWVGSLSLVAAVACAGLVEDEEERPEDDPAAEGGSATAGRGGSPGGLRAPPAAGADGGAPAGAGGGAAGGGAAGAVPAPPPNAPLAITEVMYHPVLEEAEEDRHEFVELHNRSAAPVSLAGWKLGGDIAFRFAAGTTIRPGQYLVVARNRTLLAKAYGLDVAEVMGDYTGALDNGGGRVLLQDGADAVIDGVKYDDGFPWPAAADALGAGESWLSGENLPLEKHRYRGRSLERISVDVPAATTANWAPSALDGATPGRPNGAAGTPRPIVEELAAGPEKDPAALVRAADRVSVRTRFSDLGAVKDVELEHFVDDLARADETIARTPMAAEGGSFQALLPPRPDNSIVRFRIVADRGAGREVVSPRPSDPYGWHAYFVSPASTTKSRIYHLFIAPSAWGQLWKNIQGGRIPAGSCKPNPTWNQRVPAVFVHDGRVHDIQARYSGGQVHRHRGGALRAWPHPGPTDGPAPLAALSWNLKFPRYRPFEGHGDLFLKKISYGMSCPGLEDWVAGRLMAAAGIPAAQVRRFVRLHINGGYYDLMSDHELLDEEVVQRYEGARQPPGDLFKSDGYISDQGPWGFGDGRRLQPFCGYPPLDRYKETYERKTHAWKPYDPIVALVDELQKARAGGLPALRSYFSEKFDLEALLTTIAIRNWAGAWDDTVHNYSPYKRRKDGRWMLLPWDFDLDFGFSQPANASFYMGEVADRSNRLGTNDFKDALFKSHRAELNQRLLAFSTTLLEPKNVTRLVDEAMAELPLADWTQSPTAKACTPTTAAQKMRDWIAARHTELVRQIR